MRIHKLDQAQANLLDLITVACQNGGIDANEYTRKVYELEKLAHQRQLTRRELVNLTRMVQECVVLPFYTPSQAAAWLGMSMGGLMRSGIPFVKPGHDRLILHADLVRYNETQRHWPLGDNLLPEELAYDGPSGIAALGNVQ